MIPRGNVGDFSPDFLRTDWKKLEFGHGWVNRYMPASIELYKKMADVLVSNIESPDFQNWYFSIGPQPQLSVLELLVHFTQDTHEKIKYQENPDTIQIVGNLCGGLLEYYIKGDGEDMAKKREVFFKECHKSLHILYESKTIAFAHAIDFLRKGDEHFVDEGQGREVLYRAIGSLVYLQELSTFRRQFGSLINSLC